MMNNPVLCPICLTPATDPSKSPFCTERCRRIDFFRWWEGSYAIKEELSEESILELQNRLMDSDAESEYVD